MNQTLSLWVAATHALTLGCSREEREKLLSENARRLWLLPSRQDRAPGDVAIS